MSSDRSDWERQASAGQWLLAGTHLVAAYLSSSGPSGFGRQGALPGVALARGPELHFRVLGGVDVRHRETQLAFARQQNIANSISNYLHWS